MNVKAMENVELKNSAKTLNANHLVHSADKELNAFAPPATVLFVNVPRDISAVRIRNVVRNVMATLIVHRIDQLVFMAFVKTLATELVESERIVIYVA